MLSGYLGQNTSYSGVWSHLCIRRTFSLKVARKIWEMGLLRQACLAQSTLPPLLHLGWWGLVWVIMQRHLTAWPARSFFFAQGQLFAAPVPQLTGVWLGCEAMVVLQPDVHGLPIKHLYSPMVVHIHVSCFKKIWPDTLTHLIVPSCFKGWPMGNQFCFIYQGARRNDLCNPGEGHAGWNSSHHGRPGSSAQIILL